MSRFIPKNVLRHQEKILTGQSSTTFPAYSSEKIWLSPLQQYVPKIVNWQRKGALNVAKQRRGTCYAEATHTNLTHYASMIEKTFIKTVDDLCTYDFRNHWKGGKAYICLQQCMLEGVLWPRNEGDRYPSYGESVPICGYFRVPPHEYFLLRAIAQQIVLVSVHVGADFRAYKGGIFRGEREGKEQRLSHAMNAIGYDFEKGFITLQNSWGKSWGEDGCIRFALGTDDVAGVNGVYRHCYIPYLHNQRTFFNELLKFWKMRYTLLDMGSYAPRNFEATIDSPYTPEEIKEYAKVSWLWMDSTYSNFLWCILDSTHVWILFSDMGCAAYNKCYVVQAKTDLDFYFFSMSFV
ncbi:unnamed protein product [Cuscuta epithymum]|uniref:Peptidase C1A papain C-terminal domain-containing protein n=1 Tax=Cuscuta epithymum TaxID=186058 RepID=A0AAV0FS20_9ASTE|nr:unnamed protein product [Cuscuta epithymum]